MTMVTGGSRVGPGQVRSGQARPGQARPGQATPATEETLGYLVNDLVQVN